MSFHGTNLTAGNKLIDEILKLLNREIINWY